MRNIGAVIAGSFVLLILLGFLYIVSVLAAQMPR